MDNKTYQLILEYCELTDNPLESIYILSNGELISGEFDCGMRSIDHRIMDFLSTGERGTKTYWNFMEDHSIIMVVPETQFIMIDPEQIITNDQQIKIDELVEHGYEVMDFV